MRIPTVFSHSLNLTNGYCRYFFVMFIMILCLVSLNLNSADGAISSAEGRWDFSFSSVDVYTEKINCQQYLLSVKTNVVFHGLEEYGTADIRLEMTDPNKDRKFEILALHDMKKDETRQITFNQIATHFGIHKIAILITPPEFIGGHIFDQKTLEFNPFSGEYVSQDDINYTLEEPVLESFSISKHIQQTHKGKTDLINISGSVSEKYYKQGQRIFVTVTTPNGQYYDLKAVLTSSKTFEIPFAFDERSMYGDYTFKANYMCHDSQEVALKVIPYYVNML